jgi:hypothetical protein
MDREKELLAQITHATDNWANLIANADVTSILSQYEAIHLLFMKILAIPNINPVYYSLSAIMYDCETRFIKRFLSDKCCGIETRMKFIKRMNRSNYMCFKSSEIHLWKELDTSVVIDDTNQTITMRVAPINCTLQPHLLNIINNIEITRTPVARAFDKKEADNTFFLAMSFEAVASRYYYGVDNYIQIDKKLATYYQFVANNLIKICGEKRQRDVYNVLLEMYMDAVSDGSKMNIIVHSFTRLKQINPAVHLVQEQCDLYKVIVSITQAYKLPAPGDRVHVATVCIACGASHKLKTCARCKVARFCNADCARIAWAVHKPHCNRWAEER